MDIYFTKIKRFHIFETYLFKDSKDNVVYTGKRNILSINNKVTLYKGKEKVGKITKNIFFVEYPKYRIKTKENHNFILWGKDDFTYKFIGIDWLLDANMEFFNGKIIKTRGVIDLVNFEERVGSQPNFKIEILEESLIVPLLGTIVCIYYAKNRLAKNPQKYKK